MKESSARIGNIFGRDFKFLCLAMEQAKSSDCPMKHGAVVVKAGRILSVGHNKYRNHPRQVDGEHLDKCTTHAEIDALSRVDDASGTTVYIARVNPLGKPMNSKPCADCYSEMYKRGVKRYVYTG